MTNVTGKIEAKAPNKAKKWAIKIGSTWYGTGQEQEPAFNIGDVVEFVDEMNGQWHNIKRGTLKGVAKAESSVVGNTQSPKPKADVDWDLKDKKIQQQSARNAAIAFINVLAGQSAIVYKKDHKEKDRLAALETLLAHYTAEFLDATQNVGNENEDPVVEGTDLAGEEV